MHNRRDFLMKNAPGAAMASAALLGAGARAAAPDAPAQPYIVECVTFRLQSGPQGGNLMGWLEKHAMPLWQKHKFGPVGVFTVDVGPHIPSVFLLRVYASLADRQAVWASLGSDPAWSAALAALEKDGPGSFREDMTILASTPFSPAITASAAGDPAHKLFECAFRESHLEAAWRPARSLCGRRDRHLPQERDSPHFLRRHADGSEPAQHGLYDSLRECGGAGERLGEVSRQSRLGEAAG